MARLWKLFIPLFFSCLSSWSKQYSTNSNRLTKRCFIGRDKNNIISSLLSSIFSKEFYMVRAVVMLHCSKKLAIARTFCVNEESVYRKSIKMLIVTARHSDWKLPMRSAGTSSQLIWLTVLCVGVVFDPVVVAAATTLLPKRKALRSVIMVKDPLQKETERFKMRKWCMEMHHFSLVTLRENKPHYLQIAMLISTKNTRKGKSNNILHYSRSYRHWINCKRLSESLSSVILIEYGAVFR